jgi:ribosome-associated translation inhibitor RaiA
MDIIYQNETWSDLLANEHKQNMITAFSTYFDRVDKQVKRILTSD